MQTLILEKKQVNTVNLKIPDLLKFIVQYGSLAPNSHNAQMWTIDTDNKEDAIVLMLNKDRLLPEIDPKNREAWISCGAFVYNAIVTAEHFGFNAAYYLRNDNEIVLRILAKSYRKVSENFHFLPHQTTTRIPYSLKSIPRKMIEEILSHSQFTNFYPRTCSEFKQIIRLSQKANNSQMRNQAKLLEMRKWIRYNETNLKDGMSLTDLGLKGLSRNIAKWFFSNDRRLNSNFWRTFIIAGQNQLFKKCYGYLIIRSKYQAVPDWIQTGIIMQKVWLNCTKLNISVHPMSQVVEEINYKKLLGDELGIEDEIQMVIRIGFCKKSHTTILKKRLNLI